MLALTEDIAKQLLREEGLAVPAGVACGNAADAAAAVQRMGGSGVIKALVPTGRRGKAGAVRLVGQGDEIARIANEVLSTKIAGYQPEKLYVEERVAIDRELYLSFIIDGLGYKVVLSVQGGVDIEDLRRNDPGAIVIADIDIDAGLPAWRAMYLWRKAGLTGAALPGVAKLTARLFEVFRRRDIVTLEINPLALGADGTPGLVGAMIAVDDNALPRHPAMMALLQQGALFQAGGNPREQSVYEGNYRIKGGMIRYTELDGDIGLVVLGGGAGLYQHDLIVSYGGRPSNHSDQNGINVEKLKVLVRAVVENPRARGMLVGANHQQMTRTDSKVQAVVEVLKELAIDCTKFPVVMRMFGPYEDEARRLASTIEGITFMPRGTTMADACRLIVEKVAAAAPVRALS